MENIKKDIKNLSKGVPNVYKSKHYKKIICMRLMSVLLVLIILLIVVLILTSGEDEWEGQIIVIARTKSTYNNYFYKKRFPNLKKEFDMSQETFEKKSNLLLCEQEYSDQVLEDLGLNYNKISSLGSTSFIVFVLDENGKVILECFNDEEALIKTLKETGFQRSED